MADQGTLRNSYVINTCEQTNPSPGYLKPGEGARRKPMPFYNYQCNACEDTFQTLVMGGGDADAEPCPSCGSKKVTRQVSSFSVRGTNLQKRGRVVDMSSGLCPCSSHPPGHSH
jgi:putative FmdB family regulatory protein